MEIQILHSMKMFVDSWACVCKAGPEIHWKSQVSLATLDRGYHHFQDMLYRTDFNSPQGWLPRPSV